MHIDHQPFYTIIRFKFMNPIENELFGNAEVVKTAYSFPSVRNMVIKELATFSFSLLS